ncbi:MAG: DUF3576 domain-containing protein [Magnetococcales bacterium]|nr:DUF3576 domain-containing protein [Magnetococcales bacterium]
MKNKFLLLALASMFIALSGCSKKMFTNEGKLDDNTDLAGFGKVQHDINEAEDAPPGYVKGEKGLFSFSKDGIFGSASSSDDDKKVRADKLFAGALKVILGMPIMAANRDGGLIATDWKIDPANKNTRYRINIHITGRDPYGEVDVVVLKQQKTINAWMDQPNDEAAARSIAKSIRKQAQIVRP